MAIRDITVKVVVDTTAVQKAERDAENFFNITNQAIKEQSGLIQQLQFQEKGLIRLRNATQSPEKIKAFNKEIKITQEELKRLKNLTDTQNKSFFKLNSIIGKIGAGIVGAFAIVKITRFIKESVRLFDVQAKAEQRLLTALDGQRDIQSELIKQAKDLQAITIFSDADIISAQSLIAAFTNEKDIIEELTRVTLDFATVKGIQLPSAANLVAKAFASSTNALSRYGIQVTGAAGSSERLESLVQNLDEAFGGQAEAAVIGAANIQQLSNQFEDLREKIGGFIIKESSFFINFLTSVLIGVNNLLDPMDDLEESIEGIATSINKLTEDSLFKMSRASQLIFEEQQKLAGLGELITEERIRQINEQVEEEFRLLQVTKDIAEAERFNGRNAAFLKEEIKKLTDEFNAESTSVQRNLEITSQLVPLREELARLTTIEIEAEQEHIESLEELAKAYTRAGEAAEKQGIQGAEAMVTLRNEIIDSQRELAQATFAISSGSLSVLAQFVNEGSALQIALLEFNKLLTIADILIALQRETALISANPSLTLLPDAGITIKTNLIAAARFRAGAGIAQVVATSIPVWQGFTPTLKDNPGFAEGTESSPEGLAWTGERGKELTYLAQGTKVLPNDKVNKYGNAIDAMFHNNFDDYVAKQYIPEMVMNSESYHRPTEGIYDDSRLRRDVKKNKSVIIQNEDSFAAKIAASVSVNQRQHKRYGF